MGILVSDLLDQHMNDLLRKGAIAVKPTGSQLRLNQPVQEEEVLF